MKIVHVIASLDPARGGVPAVAMRLAAAQGGLGHAVHIVAHDEVDAGPRIQQALEDVPGLKRVRLHYLPLPAGLDRLFARATRRPLAEIVAGADAVHIHGVWEPILRQAAIVSRTSGIPYCVAPAGMLDTWSLAQKRWKKRLALALGYRRMLDGAAFIHVLNRDEADIMMPLRLKAADRIIPNGVFLDEIAPVRRAGQAPLDTLLRGRRYILFLSRLHYKKGLDVLADAFARIASQWPDVDLVVAGPEGGAGEAFRRTVEAAGLGSRVHMVGGLYGPDKIAALRGAACFCLPSRQEGFSVAITEALACGVPVVISRQCHFPEVATEGAGIVVDLDAAAVAEALSAVLGDPLCARRMGRRGSALVEQRFTWPVIAEESLKAYATMPRSAER